MKKNYYNIGSLEDLSKRKRNSKSLNEQYIDYFKGCIEKTLTDGKTYMLVPLSEICRVHELEESDFLSDELLDIISTLKKQHGYPILITI